MSSSKVLDISLTFDKLFRARQTNADGPGFCLTSPVRNGLRHGQVARTVRFVLGEPFQVLLEHYGILVLPGKVHMATPKPLSAVMHCLMLQIPKTVATVEKTREQSPSGFLEC